MTTAPAKVAFQHGQIHIVCLANNAINIRAQLDKIASAKPTKPRMSASLKDRKYPVWTGATTQTQTLMPGYRTVTVDVPAMTTADYVRRFEELNHLKPGGYIYDETCSAPDWDPALPIAIQIDDDPDYVPDPTPAPAPTPTPTPTPTTKRTAKTKAKAAQDPIIQELAQALRDVLATCAAFTPKGNDYRQAALALLARLPKE